MDSSLNSGSRADFFEHASRVATLLANKQISGADNLALCCAKAAELLHWTDDDLTSTITYVLKVIEICKQQPRDRDGGEPGERDDSPAMRKRRSELTKTEAFRTFRLKVEAQLELLASVPPSTTAIASLNTTLDQPASLENVNVMSPDLLLPLLRERSTLMDRLTTAQTITAIELGAICHSIFRQIPPGERDSWYSKHLGKSESWADNYRRIYIFWCEFPSIADVTCVSVSELYTFAPMLRKAAFSARGERLLTLLQAPSRGVQVRVVQPLLFRLDGVGRQDLPSDVVDPLMLERPGAMPAHFAFNQIYLTEAAHLAACVDAD